MSDLALNDPIQVKSGEYANKEGVVAHLGSVDFDSSNDWIGVRLTGSSAGQGEHDGTCQGKSYFQCPANCGVFVKSNQISKRNLTKLEELRLRRELGTSSKKTSTSAVTPAKTVSTIHHATSSSALMAGTVASTAVATGGSPGLTTPRTSTRNKLEELKKRRAALSERREELTESKSSENLVGFDSAAGAADGPGSPDRPPPASPQTVTTATTTASSSVSFQQGVNRDEVESLQKELDRARAQFIEKEKETATLQQQLATAELKVHKTDQQLQTLKKELQAAKQEKLAAPPSNAVSPHVQEQLNQFRRERDDYAEQAQLALQEVTNRRSEWERDQKALQEAQAELRQVRTQLAMRTQEWQVLDEQTQNRSRNESSQYKERAKLQAEMSAFKRKIEQLEKEKQELENVMEDLTLDKEQLSEEKEALQDRLEELKLDFETAQMEVEELKIELEDARVSSEQATSLAHQEEKAVADGAGAGAIAEAEEMQRALSVQNARLREALIRLREQSLVEKMELTRQLRDAEKEAQSGRALSDEVETLRATKATLDEQINDLKDMVEQGAAFESMVEDLSDRLMSLEEDNVALRAVIREMEEAADLTAEMEEVQTDELKALTRDLEGRDSIIRNLEEAIKMQRRREDDFLRTVANYRSTVATLKQEKLALLKLQQGDAGEKSHLMAASQNALARAAQLVSDAAEMRRREAKALMDQIEQQMYKHMSLRLETLLPQTVVSPEIAAIKGELMASKLVSKAARTLEGLSSSLGKVIKPSLSTSAERSVAANTPVNLSVSDELRQQVTTMLYQADFAQLIVEISSQFVRFIAAGQWPDLMSQESSLELGAILSHAVTELDSMIGFSLKSLKEEGALTPEQTNIGALRQSFQVTLLGLKTDIERDDGGLLQSSWNPPGWELMKNISSTKFVCQGAAAAMSSVLHQSDDFVVHPTLAELYSNIEQAAAQAAAINVRLANIDVQNKNLVDDLSKLAEESKESCKDLPKKMEQVLLSKGDIKACQNTVTKTLQVLARISAMLRSVKAVPNDESVHALSPEAQDAWLAIANLTRDIRRVDGDEEDVNYLSRARAIEHRLGDAVDNEPKLEASNAKVAQLEKGLASRMKEVSMQTARLTELEKLLAKSSAGAVTRQPLDVRSTEEFNTLQEENRVLTEAVEVLQRQVDEYEYEIRAMTMKDNKTPSRGRKLTPRRLPSTGSDASPYSRSTTGGEDITKTGSLEATIFRPALQRALQDAARWKSASMASDLASLPPLPIAPIGSLSTTSETSENLLELTSALCNYRKVKATTKLVDLTRRDKTPRMQLRELNERRLNAVERVQSLVLDCQKRSF